MTNQNREARGSKKAGVSIGGQFAKGEQTEANGAGLVELDDEFDRELFSDSFTVKWIERDVLPTPRHRKPRDIEREFQMEAAFRQVGFEETGEAFTMPEFFAGSGNTEVEVRHYDGELYRPAIAADFWSYSGGNNEHAPSPDPWTHMDATEERLTKLLTRQERDWETGEIRNAVKPYDVASAEEARAAVQTQADAYLVVDGRLWRKTAEPVYTVNTYGFGGNHGGTSLSLDSSRSPLKYFSVDEPESAINRSSNTFTLDEFEAAQAHALKVARDRSDSDSIRSIENHQPIRVPVDRPWQHLTSAARLTGYTGPYDIPFESRDDLVVHELALDDLKQRIISTQGGTYVDDSGQRRVDFARFTEDIESSFKELSRRVQTLKNPEHDVL